MLKVVTANRLTDGVVVFFDHNSGWSEHLADARVAEGENDTADLEQQVAATPDAEVVVSVYTMDVSLVDGELAPTSMREKIRVAHKTTLPIDHH